LTAALRHPRRVGGLVLDSVMPAAVDERLAVMERLGGKEARQVARRYWSGEDSDDIRDAWSRVCLPLYSRHHSPPSLEQRMRRIAWNHDVLEHFRQVSAAQFDPWDHLDDVICPTLTLAGEHDPVATASTARRLAASLPNADTHLEVFADAGHGVFREVPEQAIAALKNFLAGQASGGRGPAR
jgi:proline iminopeptidase